MKILRRNFLKIFFTSFSIIYVDGIRRFSNKFLLAISIKSFIDFILMSFLGFLLFLNTKGFFNEFKRTKLSN